MSSPIPRLKYPEGWASVSYLSVLHILWNFMENMHILWYHIYLIGT